MEIIKFNILLDEHCYKELFCFFIANLRKVCWFNTKKHEYEAKEKDASVGDENYISECINQENKISTKRSGSCI